MTPIGEIWRTIRVAFKAATLNGLAVFTAGYTLQDGLNFTVPEVSASMVNGAAGLVAFTGWLAFDVKRRRGVLRDSAAFFGFRGVRRLTLILSILLHHRRQHLTAGLDAQRMDPCRTSFNVASIGNGICTVTACGNSFNDAWRFTRGVRVFLMAVPPFGLATPSLIGTE